MSKMESATLLLSQPGPLLHTVHQIQPSADTPQQPSCEHRSTAFPYTAQYQATKSCASKCHPRADRAS